MTFVLAIGWLTWGLTCEVHLKCTTMNIYIISLLLLNNLSKYYFEDNPFIQHLLIEYFTLQQQH